MQVQPHFGEHKVGINSQKQHAQTFESVQQRPDRFEVRFGGENMSPEQQTRHLIEVIQKLTLALTPMVDRQVAVIEELRDQLDAALDQSDPAAQLRMLDSALKKGETFLEAPETGRLSLQGKPKDFEDGRESFQIKLNGESFYVLSEGGKVAKFESVNSSTSRSKLDWAGWLQFDEDEVMSGGRHTSQIIRSADPQVLARAEEARTLLAERLEALQAEKQD